MATKISSITIVNQQGSHCYAVGGIYNDLLIDKIENKSMEWPEGIEFIYRGFTENGDIVFEVINAPVDIEYSKA